MIGGSMKNKGLLTICLIIIGLIILVGGYFVFIKDNNEKAEFLKLEKIVLKEDEKKVKVNNKEVSLKLDNGLLINNKKVDVELITNIYNTGKYLIVSYKGLDNDKYLFLDEDGNKIEENRIELNEEAEFNNLRLDTNKLLVDTCDMTVEITYENNKITIKKDNQ